MEVFNIIELVILSIMGVISLALLICIVSFFLVIILHSWFESHE